MTSQKELTGLADTLGRRRVELERVTKLLHNARHVIVMEGKKCKVFESPVVTELLVSQERMLARVNAALTKIRSGAYGHCEGCDQIMSWQRLHDRPYLEYCVSCERFLRTGES
jgi:hypothetical protein